MSGLPMNAANPLWTRQRQAGLTLIEMLVATLVLAFVINAGVMLYVVGYTQQQVAQNYSTVQQDLRTALARADRAIRHGYQVVDANTVYSGFFVKKFTNNAVRLSNATQLCIRVPQSGKGSYQEMRFYLSGGTFYCEQATSIGSPTALETNVGTSSIQSLTYRYFQTHGTQRIAVDTSPGQATEVQITLTGQSSTPVAITATAVSTVYLRNLFTSAGP